MPFGKVCCNPFQKDQHKKQKAGVRKVSQSLRKRFPKYLKGLYICSLCRRTLIEQAKSVTVQKKNAINCDDSAMNKVASDDDNFSENDSEGFSKEIMEDANRDIAFFYLNKCLEALNQSPIEFKTKFSKYKKEEILNNLNAIFRENLFNLENTSNDGAEILNHLKEIYNTFEGEKNRQMQVLTILPHSWSAWKIEKTFSTTNFMARKAKKLIENNNYIFSPPTKKRCGLSAETTDKVQDFYKNDKNSRIMPGKKDYKAIKCLNGEKVQK